MYKETRAYWDVVNFKEHDTKDCETRAPEGVGSFLYF